MRLKAKVANENKPFFVFTINIISLHLVAVVYHIVECARVNIRLHRIIELKWTRKRRSKQQQKLYIQIVFSLSRSQCVAVVAVVTWIVCIEQPKYVMSLTSIIIISTQYKCFIQFDARVIVCSTISFIFCVAYFTRNKLNTVLLPWSRILFLFLS